jgi:hypothetical protein
MESTTPRLYNLTLLLSRYSELCLVSPPDSVLVRRVPLLTLVQPSVNLSCTYQSIILTISKTISTRDNSSQLELQQELVQLSEPQSEEPYSPMRFLSQQPFGHLV